MEDIRLWAIWIQARLVHRDATNAGSPPSSGCWSRSA